MIKEKISGKQLKQLLKAQSKKIVYFIEALDATEEEKQAFYTLIKDMSLKQIDRLVDILESHYLDEITKNEDDKLKERFKKIKEKIDLKKADLEKDIMWNIQKLSNKLEDFKKIKEIRNLIF
ncbi:MAG: hypothetical protein ABH888_03625 [Patescibacteria group bacterium]|nr:hypothetical protein [Patescibacteria group bacterium]